MSQSNKKVCSTVARAARSNERFTTAQTPPDRQTDTIEIPLTEILDRIFTDTIEIPITEILGRIFTSAPGGVAVPKILPRYFFVVALLVFKKWVSFEAL